MEKNYGYTMLSNGELINSKYLSRDELDNIRSMCRRIFSSIGATRDVIARAAAKYKSNVGKIESQFWMSDSRNEAEAEEDNK